MMKIKRSLAAAAMCLALLAGGTLISAPPAMVASGDAGKVIAPAGVYYGPSYFYGLAYTTKYDAWIPLGCWTDDGQGRRWFSFAYQPQRWVRAVDVQYQPWLPHC